MDGGDRLRAYGFVINNTHHFEDPGSPERPGSLCVRSEVGNASGAVRNASGASSSLSSSSSSARSSFSPFFPSPALRVREGNLCDSEVLGAMPAVRGLATFL